MRSKIKNKIIALVSVMLAVTLLMWPEVKAAGPVSVSTNSLSVTVGATTSFTITANNAAGRVDISSVNEGVATVSTSSAFLDNSSTTVTVTGISSGSTTIKVYNADITTYDDKDASGAVSTISVSVNAASTPAPTPNPTPAPTPVTTPTTPTRDSEVPDFSGRDDYANEKNTTCSTDYADKKDDEKETTTKTSNSKKSSTSTTKKTKTTEEFEETAPLGVAETTKNDNKAQTKSMVFMIIAIMEGLIILAGVGILIYKNLKTQDQQF